MREKSAGGTGRGGGGGVRARERLGLPTMSAGSRSARPAIRSRAGRCEAEVAHASSALPIASVISHRWDAGQPVQGGRGHKRVRQTSLSPPREERNIARSLCGARRKQTVDTGQLRWRQLAGRGAGDLPSAADPRKRAAAGPAAPCTPPVEITCSASCTACCSKATDSSPGLGAPAGGRRVPLSQCWGRSPWVDDKAVQHRPFAS